MQTILVTGEQVFIGANFVRDWHSRRLERRWYATKPPYAGSLDKSRRDSGGPSVTFVQA